ncbi:MAG TPA: flavin reductase family protein [bacterium]|nr:flavin reductase family protein [bacterium]
MNEEAKKKLLRMIPHALYVLTSQANGKTTASTVSWVTQASFQPPLVAVGIKKDSHTFEVVRQAQGFVLNFLGAGQKDIAQKFFKHVEPESGRVAGEEFVESPLLRFPVFPKMAGFVECRVKGMVEQGDHAVVVAEVIEAESGTLEGPLLLSTTGWNYGG